MAVEKEGYYSLGNFWWWEPHCQSSETLLRPPLVVPSSTLPCRVSPWERDPFPLVKGW
jgi:hypothetical protein